METKISEGYKQTDVGVLPVDWEVYNLHEISEKITDGEHATPKRTNQGYYLLSARNVHDGRIDLTDVDFVDIEEYQRIRKRCNPETGDVLISCSGTIGRVAVLPSGIECVMVRSAALIKPDRAKTNSYFIQYVLQSIVGQTQIAKSLNQGAQANLFINHIEKLKIPFPPLLEQKAIAQALSDADAAIAKLDRLITKKRNIKQGATQQLLTGKKRLPGFSINEVNTVTGINPPKGYKQTEIGLIPLDWEVKQLGEIGKVSSGGTPNRGNSSYWNGNIPWITTTQIDFNIITSAKEFITEIGLQNSSAKKYSRNTLLMAMYGQGKTRGKVAILGIDATINQACAAISLNKDVYNKYVFFYLAHNYEEIRKLSNIGNQENLNGNIIKSIFLPIPPFSEQEAIAQVLTDMDAEIEALEQKRDKYKAIKQGMMQELLTGRTRLL